MLDKAIEVITETMSKYQRSDNLGEVNNERALLNSYSMVAKG